MRLAALISAFCFLPSAFAQSAAMPASDDFTKAVFFGKKFAELKDWTSAYQQFAKADALQPDQPQVLYNMAVLLAKAGRYSEAQAKVDRYNQLFPAGAEKPNITKLQLELEFQRELQKRRQTEQEYIDLFNRGRFLYSKNDLAGALKQFQDAEQKRPTDPAAVYDQAVIYEKLGDFAKAMSLYRRHEELETEAAAKGATEQRLLALEAEIGDMKTKIVCPFCGLRLPIGATWCPRCWHLASPPPACATATRATFYADGRFAGNASLPCISNDTHYTAALQRAIQSARKAEGWTYNGEIIQGWRDQVKYVQGADYLEKIVAPPTGEILYFNAHPAGVAFLLDREDVVIDGQKYTSRYTFDAQNRIVQQQVDYQNAAGCNHIVSMTADATYAGELLSAVKISGGYEGTVVEGLPSTTWTANIANVYDSSSRIATQDLAVTSFAKVYKQKPVGAEREEVEKLYDRMRPGRPIENILALGDRCGLSGTTILGNPIDLRPFYAIAPGLATQLVPGVTHAAVTFTYP